MSGGSRKLPISARAKNLFKKGLIKAAESTDSIIITNGNNKLIGKALEEFTLKNKINVIGM